MGRIIGIDLGTTNTAVAVIQDGRPRVIEDDRGYKVLPSVVSARGEGRFIVGQAAHNLILTSPDRTVYATKRLMGRRFDSPEVQRAMQRLQYQLSEGPDGGVLVKLGDEWMTPAEVAAVVLQVVRSITEKALGETVDEAVITVPAHFNNAQRQQTLEAAQLAGLRCDRLLNEPTAAALAYGHRKNIDRTLVIFDLGGGTFDVTVLKLANGVYDVLATNGDTWLGGEDFDYRIVDHLADAFQARTGSDLRVDRNALQRVKDAAERAKCDLSFSDRTNVVIPHILAGQNLETVLTRSTLESLTGDLINRCLDITRGAVADAGLPLSDIDEVVLVGGQTRMPRVREAVSGLFGREPSRSVHPEEAVAVGAAVHGSSLSEPGQPQAILLDVTPFDLGIDSSGGMFSGVIARNARVPTSEMRTFTTAHDDQTSVRITVRQGESRVAAENEFLGEFVLEGLKPAPRMQTKVDVTFRLDGNGILHVTAVDRASGEQRAIIVKNYAERAKGARMPSEEEAAHDVATRGARGAAAPAPAVGAGTKKKVGFLAALFGAKSDDKKADKATKPVGPAVAVPAAPVVEPGPAPAIDLAAVADAPTPIDADLIGEIDDDAAMAAIADEEDLYGRTGATLGMGGSRLPAPRGPGAGPEGLDAGSLFGGSTEDDDDPDTEGGQRPGRGRGYGEHTLDAADLAAAADLFGSEAGAGAPFGEATGDAGITFEGMLEDEAVLAEEYGIGEEPMGLLPEPSAPMGLLPEPHAAMGGLPEPAAQAGNPFEHGSGLGFDVSSMANPFDESPTSSGVAPRPRGEPLPPPPPEPEARKKRPAKLRLHYHERESFLLEYRDNLRRNGAFIKTEKPLVVGRECEFEVDAPGLDQPLVFGGVVSYISDGRHGEPPGMRVEYRMDDATRAKLTALVSR
ncbi:hypothetical protein LBMAG42_42040 [Deltaproteobacteria bacterium]|nr:hypothetical protein LBMAG42_42040 [Deltaproteobacteria bacterium]